jgi:ABC-type transporter Mla subunit MlaD
MPVQKKSFTVTEIKAGLLVLCSAAILAGFLVTVMKINLAPKPMKQYHTFFTGTLGLNPNALVRFGGMEAGAVRGIRFATREESPESEASDAPRLIRVDFEVFDHVPVNAGCTASVEQTTFTAERHLELSTGDYGAGLLASGAPVRGRSQAYGFIQMPDTDPILGQVESLLREVRTLLGVSDAGDAQEDGDTLAPEDYQVVRITAVLKTLLEDVTEFLGVQDAVEREAATGEAFVRLTGITREVSATLEYLRGPLFEEGAVGELLDEATRLLEQLNGALAENRPALSNTLANVEGITENVAALLDELAPRLEGILSSLKATLDNAEDLSGNARHFLEQNRPAIENLILDLGEAVRNLREFSRTLAEQPSAVIRGATPSGRRD